MLSFNLLNPKLNLKLNVLLEFVFSLFITFASHIVVPDFSFAQEKQDDSKHYYEYSLPVDKKFLKGSDLIGKSQLCATQSKYNDVSECSAGDQSIRSLQYLQNSLTQKEGAKFAEDLRRQYFQKIKSSLTSQYAAAKWLGKEDPFNGSQGESLKRAVDSASSKCHHENVKEINEVKLGIARADPNVELGLKEIPADQLEKSREFFLKRMLIAWVETNRIQRIPSYRPVVKKDKKIHKERLQKIREAYPLLGNSGQSSVLRKLTKTYYGNSFDQDSSRTHPQIDQILFSETGRLVTEPNQQINSDDEGMINQILKKPLHPQLEIELRSMMAKSLTESFESISSFCELDPCQTMQLNLDQTGFEISQHPGKNVLVEAACSCEFQTPSEYVGTGKQLLLAGGAIGGLVLCPFTFGVGCYGSAVAGGALIASSAANTYGAMKDYYYLSPLVQTATALPGLPEKSRKEIMSESDAISERFFEGASGTIFGFLQGPNAIRAGTKILTGKQTFRPIAKPTVSSEEVLTSTQSQIKELKQLGVEFKKDPTKMTSVESDLKYWPEDINYIKGSRGESHYGDILKVTKLPPASKSADLATSALEHPEMTKYIKKMDELGIDLVVDTSLRNTGLDAYHWGHTKVIALRPDSSWQTFLHEFQHVQFEAFINPKLNSLKKAVQKKGKSLSEVLPRKVTSEYSSAEIKRLEKLLKQDHAATGIDETMSTGRELDAMGWKKYLPYGEGRKLRTYQAEHRVNSLMELQQEGISLSKAQSKALLKGRAEAILAYAYDPSVTAPIPVLLYKASSGAISVSWDLNMIYNEKTGDVIVKIPDGTLIRENYGKIQKNSP